MECRCCSDFDAEEGSEFCATCLDMGCNKPKP